MNFSVLGKAVAKQFQAMTATGLYRVDIDKDLLWDTYLKSFPAGSNPIYKTRTEHDCQCCKSFIRTLGGVVTIKDGKVVTLWDVVLKDETPYQEVVDAMAALVKKRPIENIFLHEEAKVGTPKSFMQVPDSTEVHTWEHFFVNLPDAAFCPKKLIGTRLGESRSSYDVMLRSLQTIDLESIDTVLDLIAQNSLYRGEENKFAVESFRKLKVEWANRKLSQQLLFVWSSLKTVPESVSRIRNTAIGTLLVDLAEGKDIEQAVKSFETKVAPYNYKRPTALVTKAMIQKAQQKIEELGFTSALERRYATIEDITVNNILFLSRESKKKMNVFEEMTAAAPENLKNLDKVEEVSIKEFLTKVMPRATSLEVLLENRHQGNLVSLIAPADPTAKGMFKWPNNFSWSYNGEVADSIKERVKKAGGNVTGDLCCRLAWNYTDDLDFHMWEPMKSHIFYPNRRRKSANGGELDLDANGADGLKPDPAENIYYESRRTMREGVYELQVNNFIRRSDGKGFEVEIEFDGNTHHIVYEKALRSGETVTVAKIQYKAGVFTIIESLPSTQTSKVLWSVPSQTFHKVNVVMFSPNHWDEKAVGNKHYFFMLEGCLNEGRARGFFNEFLCTELDQHRKVLELVGSKMKTEESDRQLSGLGFSSTQRNHLLCRVKGAFSRVVKVTF